MRRGQKYSSNSRSTASSSLRLDNKNRKIAGVCAGLARYWGTQTVFVRLAAVIGLLLAPHAALIGYGLAYLILE
jgi:phage shock protein C